MKCKYCNTGPATKKIRVCKLCISAYGKDIQKKMDKKWKWRLLRLQKTNA